jgi:hypothetical protein
MCVVLFPYLPLRDPLQLGDRWEVRPLSKFAGPWPSDWFGDAVREIAGKHVARDGSVIQNPAVLVENMHGVTGDVPDNEQLNAIEVALGLGVVDSLPFWRSPAELKLLAEYKAGLGDRSADELFEDLVEENENSRLASWMAGTSDNVEPYIWPVNRGASIAMEYGAIVRTTVGGSVKVVAPTELNLPLGISLDSERVSALYKVLTLAPVDTTARQLREGLRWMLQAWRNTPSLPAEQRVVLLRTAFEVVLAHEEQIGKEKLARRLSERFDELLDGAPVDPGEMLWQPGLERSIDAVEGAHGHHGPYNDLERWFIGFSAARNAVVHDGAAGPLEDTEETSAFAGEYWWVATRVLRDVALAELHGRGYEALWKHELGRALRKVCERLAEGREDE